MVYLRLVLAATMIPYGAAKIFPWQFPAPTLSKLIQRYGDSSPMGLLWTFMGASRSYSFFGGATELLAGMLLVVPRLATLGALVCIGVMSNVLMLNLGYDVPVKLGLDSPASDGRIYIGSRFEEIGRISSSSTAELNRPSSTRFSAARG